MDLQPTLLVCFKALGWSEAQIVAWILRLQFDENKKNAAHLLLEDRSTEDNDRLRPLTQDTPIVWDPLS